MSPWVGLEADRPQDPALQLGGPLGGLLEKRQEPSKACLVTGPGLGPSAGREFGPDDSLLRKPGNREPHSGRPGPLAHARPRVSWAPCQYPVRGGSS